jgi:hypothetical protein
MHWHQETLRIAGRVARPSARAAAETARVEQRLGCRVPAALRALLVTDLWPGFLRDFSNGDEPLSPRKMLSKRSIWKGYDAFAAGLLPFMRENQGVCTWAVPLGSGDDPPVLVEVDSGDPPIWQTAAPTFSLWLRCQVEDHLVLDRALFAAQAKPLRRKDRASLLERFTPGPTTTGWPAREILRLHNDAGDVLLWNAADQCDWWIAPRDLSCALALLNLLEGSLLSKEIYALRSEAEPLLERWRAAK